jgi:Mg-chelatase subunit ChlI
MQRKRLVFPFSAIVGLDKLKLAILINAINPKIGGLLIKGPKGSGKSTIVRALTDIMIHPTCALNATKDTTKAKICQQKKERWLL